MATAENPYESPIEVLEDRGWTVRNGALHCTYAVTMPRICYATLSTETVEPYDVTINGRSWSDGLELAAIVQCSMYFFSPTSWHLTAIVIPTVGLFCLLKLTDRFCFQRVRIRLFETQQRRKLRCRMALLNHVLTPAALMLIPAGFALATRAGLPLILVFSVTTPIGIVLFAGSFMLKMKTSLNLNASRGDGDLVCVKGLSREYIAALSEIEARRAFDTTDGLAAEARGGT